MKFLILSSLALALGPSARAESQICEKGEISRELKGKVEKMEAEYCSDSHGISLRSLGCKNDNCAAFQKPRPSQKFTGGVGNPSFKLCRTIGGNPELVNFTLGKKLYKLDRCLFSKETWVDSATLFKFYVLDPPRP